MTVFILKIFELFLRQSQYDKRMTNTYYFGSAARSEGGASHFDVNTKKQVEFKKFNLLGGCGGRI